MSEDHKEHYDLEHDDDAESSSASPPGNESAGTRSELPAEIAALLPEHCPGCGAMINRDEGGPVPERDGTIACPRCGEPLIEPTIIEDEEDSEPLDEESEEEEETIILCKGGMGGWKAPLVIAVVALAAVLVGLLASAGGLYQIEEPTAIERLLASLRYLLFVGLTSASGWAAIVLAAHLEGFRVGRSGVAAARVLAIVALATLVMYINLPQRALEVSVELVLGTAVMFGLFLLFFRAPMHLAGIWLAIVALINASLALMGPVLAWTYGW